jgi:hypothetical protein
MLGLCGPVLALLFLLPELFSCSGPLIPRAYILKAPPLPESWGFLGPPSWHVEWIDSGGTWREEHIPQAAGDTLISIETGLWAAPVFAWPSWPGRELEKGIFRPAGAIVPFDCSGDKIMLSWQGGIDAFFYRELARLAWGSSRSPERFDWPRFRRLFLDESSGSTALSAEVRANPWLVDWAGVAEKTAASGFDRRRLVSAYTGSLTTPVPAAGPWAASNPFAALPTGDANWELKTASWVDTLVSPQGTAKVSQSGFVWKPWP